MPSTSTLVDSIYTRRVSAGECYPPDLVKSHFTLPYWWSQMRSGVAWLHVSRRESIPGGSTAASLRPTDTYSHATPPLSGKCDKVELTRPTFQ